MNTTRTISGIVGKLGLTLATVLGGAVLLATAPASAAEPVALVTPAAVSAPAAASVGSTVTTTANVVSIEYFWTGENTPRWLADLDYDALSRTVFQHSTDGTFAMIQPDGYATLVGEFDATGAIFACTCGSDASYADVLGQVTPNGDGTVTLEFDYWGTAFESDGTPVDEYYMARVVLADINI